MRACILLLLCVGLAGCSEEAGVIQYHGDEPGVDEVPVLCDRDAAELRIGITYRGDSGKQFRVVALTPINKDAAIDRTFFLPGPEDRTETLTTPAIEGIWTIRVERLDPFKGNFETRSGC